MKFLVKPFEVRKIFSVYMRGCTLECGCDDFSVGCVYD